MRVSSAILAVVLSAERGVHSFAPPSAVRNLNKAVHVAPGTASLLAGSMVADDVESSDVSVDVDAAARLAYSEWCEAYSKTPSDERFASFKDNYEQLSAANVAAAKKARDEGTERPADLKLNEFADMTVEEYMALQDGGATEAGEEQPKGALETAMEATMAQADASRSLAEAAEALEAEEQVSRVPIAVGLAHGDEDDPGSQVRRGGFLILISLFQIS